MTKDLHVNETPNEDGTAYGDALALASAQLKSFEERLKSDQSDSSQATSKIVVLLTDGENNCGLHMPEQAAAMAAEWEIKVYVISMGDMGDRQRMIVNGEAFQTKGLMNDNAWLLKKMAESTGGLYKHAEDYDSLLSVYEKIDALEKGQLQTQSLERYTPALGPFALAALLGLLFSVALRFWGLKGQ
jgi:Ca-activated chloride channel family protein